MEMPVPDPNVRADLEWFGFIQSNGLVGSADSLASVEAILDPQDDEGQALLVGRVAERTFRRVARPGSLHRELSRIRYGGPWLRLLAQGHAAQRGEPVDSVYVGRNRG